MTRWVLPCGHCDEPLDKPGARVCPLNGQDGHADHVVCAKCFLRMAEDVEPEPKRRKPRKPGRPPRAGKKLSEERIELRVTAAERRTWEAKAARDALSLSEWIRQRCNG